MADTPEKPLHIQFAQKLKGHAEKLGIAEERMWKWAFDMLDAAATDNPDIPLLQRKKSSPILDFVIAFVVQVLASAIGFMIALRLKGW